MIITALVMHGDRTTKGGPIYIMGITDLILIMIVTEKTKKTIFQKMAVKYLGLVFV